MKIVGIVLVWIGVFIGSHAGAVTIAANASAGAVPAYAGSGLAGTYYAFNTGGINNLAQANQLVSAAAAATATFTSNTICFPDCAGTSISDSSSLSALLNGNVTNFSYTSGASAVTQLNQSVMILTGYVAVTQAGPYTYYLGSDDGSVLSIGGQNIIDNDGNHSFTTDTAVVTYAAAGLYAISIEYFENNGVTGLDFYSMNDTTNQCVFGRSPTCTPGTAASGLFYTTSSVPVPEPGSIWAMAAGLIGLLAAAGRRRVSARQRRSGVTASAISRARMAYPASLGCTWSGAK